MSELKIDNPAQRLLDILEAGKKLPDARNCRKAWIELFCLNWAECRRG
ncbi:hypothetical protein GXU00_004130 [Escherichia coli]|jgi:hypothetical protein|nr:hypothetical protein [Escherichia coli]STM41989.1 Uncharacterised protein [Escherichia coli]